MDISPCIGIDVSEAWLDVSVHPSRKHWRCETSPAALASLSKRLHSLSPRVVAFEASGGYERSLAEALKQAGLSFAVINPRNVRSYARSIGVLAKTDRIDAAVIAEFAHVTKVEPKTPPSPAEQAARDLVTRRAQLVADQTREKHHCRHASGPSLASAERHLAFLKQELAAVEQELRQVIAGDAALRALGAVGDRPGCRCNPGRRVGRYASRTGACQQSSGCDVGRRGSARPRQREERREALLLGRPVDRADGALHAHALGDSA